jgi:PLP dependent protein
MPGRCIAFQANTCYFSPFMFKDQLQNVELRIQEACKRSGRSPDEVTVVAVTKTLSVETINEAISAGLLNIGENRIQEYLGKRSQMLPHSFHMIGHLQRNKVRQIIDDVKLIHSVDTESLADEIEKRCQSSERSCDVLIEVNSSGEVSKEGVAPADVEALAGHIMKLPHLRLKGLMTVAEYLEDAEAVRPSFRMLRNLRSELQQLFPDASLSELSMGMTNDFEIAIEEGATMIRIGSALFGSRTYN